LPEARSGPPNRTGVGLGQHGPGSRGTGASHLRHFRARLRITPPSGRARL